MNRGQFVTILVITFIVSMIWLISDIVFNTKASIPPNPKQEALLQPVNPSFSDRVLNLIGKNVVSSNEVAQVATGALPPAPKPSSSASPSLKPSPTPLKTATPSAIITQPKLISTQSAQIP